MDSFYTLSLLDYSTHKGYTNHFVHLELVLLESGRNFLQHFVADSCLTHRCILQTSFRIVYVTGSTNDWLRSSLAQADKHDCSRQKPLVADS